MQRTRPWLSAPAEPFEECIDGVHPLRRNHVLEGAPDPIRHAGELKGAGLDALFEARRGGIPPFCVTIDDNAGDHLPYMYGTTSFTIADDVRKLPCKLSDIYRKLTT